MVKRKFFYVAERTCRTSKTVVKCKFGMWPSNPFVTSDVSEVQNCGKMDILRLRVATLSSFRARRMFKTVVKWAFWTSPLKTGVFVVVFLVVFLWWCCGYVFVVVCWCFCGGVFVVVFCGGVFAVMFSGGVLWWCFQTSPKVLLK